MKRIVVTLFPLLVIVLLAGCSLIAPTKSSPTSTFPPLLTTEPGPPEVTPIPATQTPANTPSPTPYQPFEAVTLVDNLNLRSGPGFLLDSLGMYGEKETVSVLGRAPGASWLYVQTADGKYGYMKLELLDLQGNNMYDAPEVEPDGFVIIRGHVYTPSGNPASQITVSLLPGGEVIPGETDAATTDILGRFYFFLPAGSKGNWTLQALAYGCESNAVNSNCYLIGSFPPPIEISFKESPDVWYNIQILP